MILLSLVGCANDTTLSTTQATDLFVQDPEGSVDILMVIDDSCSMAGYQAQLGTSFDAFIEYFTVANVDYRLGVTTTDNRVENAGSLVGPPITPATPGAAAVFADMVNVGIDGSTLEMGLETAWKGMSNPDFIRDEASFSVIMVSDEEDSSPRPVNDYINAFFDAKGGRHLEKFNFSSITVTNEAMCTSDQAARSTPSVRYVDVARQTQGAIGNLCATGDAFVSVVAEASLVASGLESEFLLSRAPDPRTLVVTLTHAGAEETLPCDAGDWTYRLVGDGRGGASPAVVFDRDSLPPAGSEVSVTYKFGNGQPGTFCQ